MKEVNFNMNNNEIITKEIKKIDYLQICKNITYNNILSDDLYQHVILIILEIDNDKLSELYLSRELKYYMISIIRNEWYNKYSKFNNIYRKYSSKVDSNMDLSEVDLFTRYNEKLYSKLIDISINENESERLNMYIIEIDKILNDEKYWTGLYDWYQLELFKMYYKLDNYNMIDGKDRDLDCKSLKSSFRKMEKRVGIDHVSLSLTVKDTTNYIKSILRSKHIL